MGHVLGSTGFIGTAGMAAGFHPLMASILLCHQVGLHLCSVASQHQVGTLCLHQGVWNHQELCQTAPITCLPGACCCLTSNNSNIIQQQQQQ